MTRNQTVETLRAALVGDAKGRYSFAHNKALVSIKVRGRSMPFIFHKSDQVAFRIDAQALIIERLESFAIEKRLFWADVEAVSAGDPETDSGSLFQGSPRKSHRLKLSRHRERALSAISVSC